ncbi:site-specific integrase [Micromonospora echinospora]|uniref:site-specific integrase n=1 Tax=Micromonospora echinospora TaxID=1877 RepID=UPI001E58288E|nr:site-specific integrase [Micromonospora echinospora]
MPAAILPALRDHLAGFVDDNPEALVFTTPSGKPIWRGNLNKVIGWPAAVNKLGVPGLHFHDLRHSGNTFAARTGASTRELMARMGHDSSEAALIYQHATAEADRAIAQAVSDAVKAERKKARKAAGGKVEEAGQAEARRPGRRDGRRSGPARLVARGWPDA